MVSRKTDSVSTERILFRAESLSRSISEGISGIRDVPAEWL